MNIKRVDNSSRNKSQKFIMRNCLRKIIHSFILLLVIAFEAAGFEKPVIFPIPLKVEITGGNIILNNKTLIVVPEDRSEANLLITELLLAEFGNKFRIPISIIKTNELPNNQKIILIGTLDNPLVKTYCEKNSLTKKVKELGEEGYVLLVNDNGIVVAAKTDKGALYGFQSFRQLLKKENNVVILPKIRIEDKPHLAFRAIRLFMPGRDNIPFFKRFVRDLMAKYKFNTVVLEFNANMWLESHPEFNVGTLGFAEELDLSRRGRPSGLHNEYQNSSHHDNADGEILEKSEVADLVKYIRKFNIEIIPEIPSLTHAYYLLFGHKDLAEIPNIEYPDTYCPLKPENYKNYFEILDEYIEVIKPKIIHIGHDEWRMEKDLCELCRGKDYGELFADDINKIHSYLSKKGIKTAIWGDHLLESVREKDHRVWKTNTGYEYKIPGGLTQGQVKQLIPKDILIFNWFWGSTKDKGTGNDVQIADLGFEQVYGNLRPDIIKWNERAKINGLLGGSPSSWAGTTEMNLGKDLMFDFLACANLLWSKHYQTPEQVAYTSQALMPLIKEEMSGKISPSKQGLPISFVDLEANFNSTLKSGIDSIDVSKLLKGKISANSKIFNLASSEKRAAVVYSLNDNSKTKGLKGITINKDIGSLLFLHAVANEGFNTKAYKKIYNFDDTAELLGWYEIVYEDGFIATIPIRYGINILDWNVHERIAHKLKGKSKYAQNKYAYEAEAVSVSGSDNKEPITFFAYEWENLRHGELIKEVNLKAVKYKKGHGNAIILLAISTVDIKLAEDAKKVKRVNKKIK